EQDKTRTALTDSLLDRGIGLCEEGHVGRGLLLLARGLEAAPPGATDLKRALRYNLAGWGAALPALTALLPPPDRVEAVPFSPDGRTLLTGSGHNWEKRGELRLWDTATGRLLRTVPQPAPVLSLACTADAVVTGGEDGTLRVWSLDSGKRLAEAPAVAGWIFN